MWVGILGSMSIWPPTTSVTRLAGWSVLFQVEAQSRQFAVWHQEEARQAASHQRPGRPGDGPGRLSAVHPARGVGCSATFFCPSGKTKSGRRLFGGRELDFLLPCQLSQALALSGARAGNRLAVCWTKTRGTRNHLLHEQSLWLIAPSSSSHPAFFSLLSRLFPVLPLLFR